MKQVTYHIETWVLIAIVKIINEYSNKAHFSYAWGESSPEFIINYLEQGGVKLNYSKTMNFLVSLETSKLACDANRALRLVILLARFFRIEKPPSDIIHIFINPTYCKLRSIIGPTIAEQLFDTLIIRRH